MAQKVAKAGVKRESGYLYYLDGNGNVTRVKMARRGQKVDKKKEVVAKTAVKKEAGYLYFIDKQGDVARAKMVRGGKKKKKK